MHDAIINRINGINGINGVSAGYGYVACCAGHRTAAITTWLGGDL